MSVVTMPFDYDKLEDSSSVVPICIEDTDREGRRITLGLVHRHRADREPASPFGPPKNRRIARFGTCGINGTRGLVQVRRQPWPVVHAKWNVEDLRVGGWRARQSCAQATQRKLQGSNLRKTRKAQG